ncbi:hypothetical protein ACQ4PT_071579 [Festuca glaucescens]
MNEVPSHFLIKSSGSLSIDGLIADAIKSELDDDNFLRRAVLVALGTVLAPKSIATVPLEYWAIVKYVKRMKKLNFNGFTRTFLINNIKKLGSGYEMVQWPCGNLALLQYIYYEKVRPIGSPLTSSRPLMRNWTEEAAKKRDNVDYVDGRGVGLIDDDISAKHRREVINTPDIAPTSKRKQSKKAKAAASSMKTPGPVDDTRIELMFDQMMIKLTNHIDKTISKQMEKCADVSAQKLLKMLNAKGAVYRAGKADMYDDEDQEDVDKKEGVASTPSHGLPPKYFMDCDDIIKSDGIASWLNSGKGQQDDESDDASKKTEPIDDSKFVTPTDKKKTTNGANAGYTMPVKHGDTPEVPIIIDDKATPASSCSPPIDLTLPDASEEFDSFNTMCRKVKESGKKEEKKEHVCGKRKRNPPLKLRPPSIVMTRCPKQTIRPIRKGPAALFNYEDATDGSNPLTPEIIDAAVQYVRITCKAKRKDKKTGKTVYQNGDGAAASADFIKAYFAVNIADCHWVTVIMHGDKKEFQVLDSLWPLSRSKGFVQKLRAKIVKDVEFANNEISEKKYPDVSNWEIKSYDIPKQKDANSCGLFLLACMEHWDGDELTAEVS